MNSFFLPSLAAALGAALALPLQYAFNTFPEAWLQDYDFDPRSKNYRPARRMMLRPHTLTVMAALAFLFFCAFFVNEPYISKRNIFHILLMLLPLLPLMLIVISDCLNRIIPDQLVLAAALCSVFGFLADGLEGSLWITSDAAWYMYPANRIMGGVIGALILWGIGSLGELFSGQESMGFGDIKLIFACGLLSGAYGLLFVFFFAFIMGGIFAVPLYINKRKRIHADDKAVRESNDPEKTRAEIETRRSAVHFSDDPDYIAFGPFLAVGTALFLIFETPVRHFFEEYILVAAGFIL